MKRSLFALLSAIFFLIPSVYAAPTEYGWLQYNQQRNATLIMTAAAGEVGYMEFHAPTGRTKVFLDSALIGGSITVREVDGAPSVSSISGLTFSNGTVTDNGDGTVTISVLPGDSISDTAYGAGWDTDATHAPSKNAIYDQMETLLPKSGGTLTGNLTIAGKNLTVTATLGSDLSPAYSGASGVNWTLGAGWETPIAGGVLNKNADGTGTATPTAATNVESGETYYVTWTVTELTVGTFSLTFGGVTIGSTISTTGSGWYTTTATTKPVITPTNTSRFKVVLTWQKRTLATGDLTVDGNLTVRSPSTFDSGITVRSGNINFSLNGGKIGIGGPASIGGDITLKPSSEYQGIVIRESDDGNNAIAITAGSSNGIIDINYNGSIAIHLLGNGDNYINPNSGNLGVGATTTPSAKLDVFGTAISNIRVVDYSTTPVTIAAPDVKKSIITNSGAGAASTWNLPAATVGMVITAYVVTAQTIKLEPNGTDRIQILTNAAGDSVTSDATIGTYLTLVSLVTGSWYPSGYVGAWADTD